MDPIPVAETLIEQSRSNRLKHVRLEIELSRTFMDWINLERQMGATDGAALSLKHARQALVGAREGLKRIQWFEHLDDLRSQIEALETEFQALDS